MFDKLLLSDGASFLLLSDGVGMFCLSTIAPAVDGSGVMKWFGIDWFSGAYWHTQWFAGLSEPLQPPEPVETFVINPVSNATFVVVLPW